MSEGREQQSSGERQPEVPRVQIQGEEAIIPRMGEVEGDHVTIPKKVWG